MAETTTRDLKLIQYLNEAYGTEKQLETALEAHIGMATKEAYKKRLKDHLRETKSHAKQVERRIKQLGGKAETVPGAVPEAVAGVANVAQTVVGKAAAAAQGPLHAIRGTGEEEKQLKNMKTELASEAEEIATYTAIEALAEVAGDKETAKLARTIRREEERMHKFLSGQIPQMAKAVARAEIPAAERRAGNGGSRRRSSSSRSRSSSSGSRASASSRSTAARKSSSSKKASASTRKPASSRSRSSASGSRSSK